MEATLLKGKDKRVTIKDYSICYDDLGNSDTPIIFIHGFPFDKSSWQPQMDFLESTHRVISYDIRGYGKSTPGKETPGIRLFADDLINFMDQLEITNAIICGLSMGGYIALNAVTRFPEKFKAIILSDTQCIADSPETKVKRQNSISQVTSGGSREFIEGLINNLFCKETLQQNQTLVDKIRTIMLTTNAATITGSLNALAQREDMCSSLTDIQVPALIICGKEDVLTPPAKSEQLQINIDNSTLRIIDKAGHLSNLEQPDQFNKHLNEFILSLN